VKEFTQTFDEVLKFINNKKIDNPNVNAELKEYKNLIEGAMEVSGYGNHGTYLSDKVRDIILAVEASGYKDKIKDYGIYDQNGIRTGWKISKAEQKLDGLLARRREEREARIWGAWEDIWQIYDAVYNKFDRWEQVVKSGKFLDKLSFGSFYGKVKMILEDSRDVNSHNPFEVEDYKRNFFRVNEVLQAEIEGLIAGLPDRENAEAKIDILKINYDLANHSLVVADNAIKFNKDDSNQAELCRVLFMNKESIDRSWDTEEVLEAWDYPEDRIYDNGGKLLKENRLKIYQTAEKINNKVMKVTKGKVIDLLIYSTKAVSVNQKYREMISFKNVS
jgi:hypothetical protein